MSFTGFSEEDLQRMKFAETGKSGPYNPNVRKIDKLGLKNKRTAQQYKTPTLQTQNSDDIIDNIDFDKCRLSLKSPSTPPSNSIEDMVNNNKDIEITDAAIVEQQADTTETERTSMNDSANMNTNETDIADDIANRRNSVITPDVVKFLDSYNENEVIVHKINLEELQLKQKLMEEQNKKRKEMLAKALADRTKQTEEEVNRLEKIKKELAVLDGQFSLDVGVLRKKIDQASLTYSDAEKHYLKVEKEFLQAKINLQKEKEKKELLIEHLCALITYNETRKAQKLETLMLELANDRKNNTIEPTSPVDDKSIIIDGVDERTGKMVELSSEQS
ncbi:uncharacterized protein Gorab [Epargyreus clarus]|uniref:uncharacterized protein Gorab n=1 Tax=Epargyreus clarus TaxID=520877 RepID=UPI003C2CF715